MASLWKPPLERANTCDSSLCREARGEICLPIVFALSENPKKFKAHCWELQNDYAFSYVIVEYSLFTKHCWAHLQQEWKYLPVCIDTTLKTTLVISLELLKRKPEFHSIIN